MFLGNKLTIFWNLGKYLIMAGQAVAKLICKELLIVHKQEFLFLDMTEKVLAKHSVPRGCSPTTKLYIKDCLVVPTHRELGKHYYNLASQQGGYIIWTETLYTQEELKQFKALFNCASICLRS